MREWPPSDGEAASGTTPTYLNGVYRYTLTKQDAIAAGQGDDPEYPMTQTFWLDNGSWTGSGGASGRYWVKGDVLFIEWDEFDSSRPTRSGSPATTTAT